MARYLGEMELHHFGVDIGQSQRGTLSFGWTDRAKQIGVLVALVGRLARPRSAFRPLPYEAVLLADAGFVLEPYFDRRLRR
jgi:hypothetical protein